LVLVDWERSAWADDVETVERILELDSSLSLLLATGDAAALGELVKARVASAARVWYLSKPLDRVEAGQLVALQLERQSTRRQLRRTANQLDSVHRTLDRARRETKEVERLKSQFMANVSHEIRTPMNSILGFSRLLLKESLPPDQAEKVRYVHDSGNALLGIINNILDFSKLAAGVLKPIARDFDLDTVLRDLLDVTRPSAREKGLAIHCRAEQSVPRRLRGDATRFRQILVNLVQNAIKFTEHGSIHVQVTLDDETDPQVTLRTVVTDTGVGISPDRQAVVFDSFSQADGSATRQFEGLGLGLTISKYLADLLGGQIGFRSAPGEGSSFWFTAVFDKRVKGPEETSGPESADRRLFSAEWDAPSRLSAAENRKLRILVADDDQINRSLLEAFLTRAGCLVDLVGDGREALAVLKGSRYDLVVMDVQMPRLDGLETIRRVRHDEAATGRHTSIIALTAQSSDGDRQACLEAGADDFVTKPLSSDALFDAIGGLLPGFAELLQGEASRPVECEPARDLADLIPALRQSLEDEEFLDLEYQIGHLRNQATSAGEHLLADHAMRIQLAARGRQPDRIRLAIDCLEHALRGGPASNQATKTSSYSRPYAEKAP
jgi:signal transduction histidine kinase/DNA-binding response OmpR family regulator